MYLSVYLSIYPSIHLSLSLSLSRYLSIYLSFFLSSICLSIYLQDQKQRNSARLPECLNITTSETKQFCETSSFFEIEDIKIEQKQKNSARLPSEVESWVQSWQPRTNAFCDFSSPPENWCQVIRSAAPVTQNHLSKPAHLILQNATPLRKSAPWPPNISHEHVLCTAPATENASLQILFKCPMPAIVFGNATKPARFAHFWRGAQSFAPATRNDIWTSKSGPNP